MKKELLIFGANGALGKGITEVLISKDYSKIFLFDLKTDEQWNKVSNVENIIIRDLSIEQNVIDAFQEVKPAKDKILFLYSTVGGFFGGKSLWETNVDEWDKAFNMNLKSNYLIAKHFSKVVIESAAGSICFTAANTGLIPEARKAAYGASKGALIHLVKTLALEGKEINLSVNAIAPYIIDTPANREWMKDADFDKWIKPKEIGEFIYSLFSNYYFITGNIINLTHRFKIFP
jgi:NAD(P)-dependent dehydrogenase (short-subunit alcohol dehydrogenase family)